MREKFLKFIALITIVAVFMNMGICAVYSEDSFPVYDTTKNVTSEAKVTGESGKLPTDGFSRLTTAKAGTFTIVHNSPMADFYCGFDIKLNTKSVDWVYITMQNYKKDWTKGDEINLVTISEANGVQLADSDVLADEWRNKTIITPDNFKYGQWHRVDLYACYMSDTIKLWIDGKLFEIALNPTKYAYKVKTEEETEYLEHGFLRYGMEKFLIKTYLNKIGNYIDIDNYVFLKGPGNAINNPSFENPEAEAGHTNHEAFDLNISGQPAVVSTPEGAVQNNIIEIPSGITAGEFIEKLYTVNTDTVRVFADKTYSRILDANEVMTAENAVVAARDEKYFAYYTLMAAQGVAEDEIYTVNEFSALPTIAKKTVHDASKPIKPMTVNDASLTEKITAGNGGKLKKDRIYTFNYNTAPKIEQLLSLFESQSHTDNYTEFDFKLNDDNAQIILYYNYFKTNEYNSAGTINEFLKISSDGIAVANNAAIVKPGEKIVNAIEPSQWHRIGVFFSNTAKEVVVYFDAAKYTIPVTEENNILQYGARAVRWRLKSKRESLGVSLDNLYMEPLYEGTVDSSARIVDKPVLTSFNDEAVSGNILYGAKGMSVAQFKENIAFENTSAVRIYTDGLYNNEVTYNDDYILTNASKVVLSNMEKIFSYYSTGDATSVDITSDTLTVDGEYIHGYKANETVQSFISQIALPEGAAAFVFSGDILQNASATVEKNMILKVISADKTKSKDYIIFNGELFAGNAELSFSGVNTDGTYNNTTIDITVPVINYTNESKSISVIVACYKGDKLDSAKTFNKEIAPLFDGNITQQYVDASEKASDAVYKVFVWEKNTLKPLLDDYYYSSKLAGKKIVVFGDSISAPANGYVPMLASALNAEVINAAVPGSRFADRADNDSYGKYKVDLQNIVDGLITENYDWSTQEGYSSNAPNVLNFKNIDLANTDVAVIWLGTNDFGEKVTTDVFEAAVNDVLGKLTGNYPNLKIVIASPIYRARIAGGDGRNCYDYPNGQGNYLEEFCESLEKISKNYENTVFLDLYNESGITKFSNEKYNYLEDGLHPVKGEASRAYKVINSLFVKELTK